MGGSRRKPSLDFFPRIVDVLKWHLPTLRKIERNLFSSPPSSFFWPDQTFAIENISYLLQEKIYVKLFEGKAEIRQKRVNRKFLGSWAAKFCSSPSTSISKPKISPLHWGAKSGGTIKNETTWYQIRCGMGFTLVCAACSREREWKNNLNCSITQKRIVPSWFSISIRIDANRLHAAPAAAVPSVRTSI